MRDVVFADYSEDILRLLKQTEIRALKAHGENWKKIACKIITQKKIIDTGALKESMTYEVDEEKTEITVGVKSGFTKYGRVPEKYAIYQELGTAKMAARPFIVPSVEEANGGFLKTIREEAEYTGLSSTQTLTTAQYARR